MITFTDFDRWMNWMLNSDLEPSIYISKENNIYYVLKPRK
jgi:hypothetical protein